MATISVQAIVTDFSGVATAINTLITTYSITSSNFHDISINSFGNGKFLVVIIYG
jgi:hypothetical protein